MVVLAAQAVPYTSRSASPVTDVTALSAAFHCSKVQSALRPGWGSRLSRFFSLNRLRLTTGPTGLSIHGHSYIFPPIVEISRGQS